MRPWPYRTAIRSPFSAFRHNTSLNHVSKFTSKARTVPNQFFSRSNRTVLKAYHTELKLEKSFKSIVAAVKQKPLLFCHSVNFALNDERKAVRYGRAVKFEFRTLRLRSFFLSWNASFQQSIYNNQSLYVTFPTRTFTAKNSHKLNA